MINLLPEHTDSNNTDTFFPKTRKTGIYRKDHRTVSLTLNEGNTTVAEEITKSLSRLLTHI